MEFEYAIGVLKDEILDIKDISKRIMLPEDYIERYKSNISELQKAIEVLKEYENKLPDIDEFYKNKEGQKGDFK